MFGFFHKKKISKPKATIFVDYEHWFISLDRMHDKKRPDVRAFRDELSNDYDIQDIIFFADFSNYSIRAELPKIREITNHIIETQNTSSAHKKDFTDFIMLDHIYQLTISSPSTEAFILFSGDGHFSSVVNYLRSKLGKEVGVCAVRGGLSTQLKNTASWSRLYPENNDPMLEGYKMILSSLKNLSENKQKKSYPTFRGTVDSVARYNRKRTSVITKLLRELMNKGCITQVQTTLDDGKKIKTLKVDWQKCKILGYWE
jgi:uncharacterized LabA/DUF88 family protein